MISITVSNLPKTWLIDIDGVIFKHNGYLSNLGEQLNPGITQLLENISEGDRVILLTSRPLEYRDATIEHLNKYNVKYDQIIFGLPHGERILINDMKSSGLNTAIAINTIRDNLDEVNLDVDLSL